MSAVRQEHRSSSVGVARRTAGIARTARGLGIATGYLALLAALYTVLALPNDWLAIGLAAAATALLAVDRRLGPLPAALLVMLAMPVGRGAEVGLPEIAGIPVRPHDAAAFIGIGATLPRAFGALARLRQLPWMAIAPIIVFLAVGAVALGIGILGDQALRDVIRDARWWAFYAVALLAVMSGTRRPAVIRAFVWGLTLYAVVVLAGLLMPVLADGLKWQAYVYDPRMRLHFGQTIFLIVALGYVAAGAARRPAASGYVLLALLAAAVGVTLTRTLILGAPVVTALAAGWVAWEVGRSRRGRPRGMLRTMAVRAVPALLAVVVGMASGFGTYQAGVHIWAPIDQPADQPVARPAPSEGRPIEPVMDRVFEDTVGSGFRAQVGGRLASYGYAFADAAAAPVLGHGLGKLARVPWAWGGVRARTLWFQPGVDNAYLTIGLKAGGIGIAAFAAMMLWPLRSMLHRRMRRLRSTLVPVWLVVLGLTLIQSFAVSGYAPFGVALLLVLPFLHRGRATPPPH